MKTKVWCIFSLALSFLACSAENVDDGAGGSSNDALSRDDVRSFDKADWPVDYCELYGWYGDGVYCDAFCPLPDPDCAKDCGDLGGSCLSDPGDPGFGALCEDLGMQTLPGTCEAINQTCCGFTGSCSAINDERICRDRPDCEPELGVCLMYCQPEDIGCCEFLGCKDVALPQACEDFGGSCLSDPMDVGFGANCEELGMKTEGKGACAAFNQTCCVPVQPPPPSSCEDFGGSCLSDPMDVGFGANCEELGMETAPIECPYFNQTCCVPSEPKPSDCEAAGGTCLSDPGDPGFSANCEELGMETVPAVCEAFNQSCCKPI